MNLGGAAQAVIFMGAGMAMSMLREAPKKASNLFMDLFSVHVAIDTSDAVHWVGTWLAAQPYGKTCRRLKLWIRWRSRMLDEEAAPSNIELEPGDGTHFFRHDGRWVMLNRDEQRNDQFQGRTTLHLRMLGRDRRPLEQLVRLAVDYGINMMLDRELVRVNGTGDTWKVLEVGTARGLGSVVLPDGQGDRVAVDLRRFLEAREWYASRGVPYRRGYLFEGIPGSGKTSLARALAHDFRLTLYVLDLSGPKMTDQELFSLLAQVPPRSMILVEDVDRTRPAQKTGGTDEGGVTMSGLLNAIDGSLAGEGRVLVFTTNNIDQLDPAMLRPGRVDYRIAFGPATPQQAHELYLRFYPGELAGAAAFTASLNGGGTTVAELQGQLLTAVNAGAPA